MPWYEEISIRSFQDVLEYAKKLPEEARMQILSVIEDLRDEKIDEKEAAEMVTKIFSSYEMVQ